MTKPLRNGSSTCKTCNAGPFRINHLVDHLSSLESNQIKRPEVTISECRYTEISHLKVIYANGEISAAEYDSLCEDLLQDSLPLGPTLPSTALYLLGTTVLIALVALFGRRYVLGRRS